MPEFQFPFRDRADLLATALPRVAKEAIKDETERAIVRGVALQLLVDHGTEPSAMRSIASSSLVSLAAGSSSTMPALRRGGRRSVRSRRLASTVM